MRIGLLSFEMTASGGEQRQLLWLAKELRARGHQVVVCAYRYDPVSCYPDVAREFRVRSVEQVAPGRLPRPSNALSVLGVAARRYFLESRALARLVDPVDVLNPHGRPAHRAAVFVKHQAGVPVVWMCNDLVSWEKPGHRARMPASVQSFASRAILPLERRIVREINCIAALDQNSQEILLQTYGRPTRLVRSGLDAQKLQESSQGRQRIRSRFGIPDQAYLAVWLGILSPYRRLEDLIQAVRLRREQGAVVHLLILGRHDAAPEYARSLMRLVAEQRLEPQVRFAPEGIPEAELADYYSASDVFVFPNDHQAWGLAPLEALACRRPVIVSRGSGVHEVLREGETALLVPPGDPPSIAEALRILMESPTLARKIACQGRKWVEQHFSWRSYATDMIELFEEALEKTKRRADPTAAVSPARNHRAGRFLVAASREVP